MTEEQVKQFTKRPPAQYRRPEFYFRGGDALREQEYLQEEYKKALSDFRIAQQRLQQLQEEVDDATDVLAEREGYTKALATYLERDTQKATTENQMKNQLRKLEREIADLEVALKEVKSYHNPAALAALQKEKAHYMIEIQRGNRTISTQLEQRDEAIRQIAACSVNGRYRETRNLEYAVEKTTNKKNRLRKSVANLKKEFDILKPKTPYQDTESRACRTALTNNIKLKIELYRTQEREAVRKSKHERHINDLLDQIAELNDRMTEIGIPDDVVNIDDKFRERVLNEDYSDDDDVEEEQEEPQYYNAAAEEDQPQVQADQEQNNSDENKEKSETEQKSETDKNEEPSMSGEFDDDDNKSKSATNKSMSNDFDDDEKKTTSGGGDDDDDEKSKSTTNKSMSNDFDDDDEKKTTSGGGDDDDDEKKTTSGGGDDDDDDEKKTTSGGGDDDDDDEKKTTSGGGDDDDDDEKKTTSGGGDDDDDDEKKSATENDDDDDDKKNSESNDLGDDDGFDDD